MRYGSIAARVLQAAARELTSARREHPFAAAATRRQAVLGLFTYGGFVFALVGSVVAAFGLNFNTVSHAAWANWARLAVGLVLIAEGLLIVTDWQAARRLLLRRLYHRFHGADAPPPPRLRLWFWRLFGQILVLVGIAWVAVGCFEAARGARSMF